MIAFVANQSRRQRAPGWTKRSRWAIEPTNAIAGVARPEATGRCGIEMLPVRRRDGGRVMRTRSPRHRVPSREAYGLDYSEPSRGGLVPATKPLAGGSPELVMQEPFRGPRHDRVGDQAGRRSIRQANAGRGRHL